MNILFQTCKPRGFHHVPIYFDEQKERIEEARKQMARQNASRGKPRRDASPSTGLNIRRRKPASAGTMVLAAVVLLVILFMLMIL